MYLHGQLVPGHKAAEAEVEACATTMISRSNRRRNFFTESPFGKVYDSPPIGPRMGPLPGKAAQYGFSQRRIPSRMNEVPNWLLVASR
jgi:hypothetical protein